MITLRVFVSFSVGRRGGSLLPRLIKSLLFNSCWNMAFEVFESLYRRTAPLTTGRSRGGRVSGSPPSLVHLCCGS